MIAASRSFVARYNIPPRKCNFAAVFLSTPVFEPSCVGAMEVGGDRWDWQDGRKTSGERRGRESRVRGENAGDMGGGRGGGRKAGGQGTGRGQGAGAHVTTLP